MKVIDLDAIYILSYMPTNLSLDKISLYSISASCKVGFTFDRSEANLNSAIIFHVEFQCHILEYPLVSELQNATSRSDLI
jgi:hypothetical protein